MRARIWTLEQLIGHKGCGGPSFGGPPLPEEKYG